MSRTDPHLSILAYHSILPDADDLLSLHPAQFRDQLSWLADHGFKVISLQDAVEKLDEVESGDHCVVLTFDDGYANFLDYALPELEAFNFQATIFLVTGKLGQESAWNRFSKPHRLLNLAEVESLRQEGCAFGSHTVNHTNLVEAIYPQVQLELDDSLSFIKGTCGEVFLPLSYPFGAAGKREFNAVKQAGYDCACVIKKISLDGVDPRFRLERIEVHADQSLAQFAASIQKKLNLQSELGTARSRAFSFVASMRQPKKPFMTADTQDMDAWIGPAVIQMDQWLDTMRGPGGYTGPVTHWWRNSLYYAGCGLDWRYEGIISGYLTLYQKTGQATWLDKAETAGKDLAAGLLDSGNFRFSNFELNPYSGGTPHEAACDLGLLALAAALKESGRSTWETYFRTAQRNVETFVLNTLWDKPQKYFHNTTDDATFAPNKAGTIVEALLFYMKFVEDENIYADYIAPTLEKMLACQVQAPDHSINGAIEQGILNGARSKRYFPYYIARCIPALVQGYQLTGDARYLHSARSAMEFILRFRLADGSFPAVVYENNTINQYPRWVAGTGDILRAMDLLRGQGMEIDLAPTLHWLLRGLLPSGGVRTAYGFGATTTHRRPSIADFRDLLPACGWVDKAFRFLATRLPQGWQPGKTHIEEVELDCIFQGQPALFRETRLTIEVIRARQTLYGWQKGEAWARVA
jgi:peptidoglycan/xylan/chitin deacetylase (PgdA/CDA1 family)